MSGTAEMVIPRGWYYGWNIVAVIILAQLAANGLTYNAFSLFVHDWSVDLHAPISQLQLSVAAMALVAALVAPAIGTLADKYPARILFATGLAGIGIFYVAISMATAAWQVIALYGLLVPIALGLSTSVTANPVISRWFTRRLGLALGLSSFGLGMAGVVLPPIIAALLPEFGWRLIWRGGGLLVALVAMPLVVFVMRDRPTEREGLHYLAGVGTASIPHGHPSRGQGGQLTWRAVLVRRNFWLLVFIYIPIMAAYGGVGQNVAPFASNHGLSQAAGGELLSALSLSHVISNLVLGLLADRFGCRLPLVGLAVAVAIGAGVLAASTGFWAIAFGCVLVGLGGGIFTLLAAAIAAEFGAGGVGRAFGMIMFFIPLGALTPFAIARVQESTGSYTAALIGLVGLVIMSGVLSLLLREHRPQDGAATLRAVDILKS
jgi:OFA family oxalate/formate antiporter-like MFS transporter